ncbi:MAG: PilW family protein [Gammaproteobacteria bacterium]|nr:PilW family protein [Gammaproteobacteria bacterium]
MTRLPRKQPILAWKIQAGVGLIEIMIALVIGLILIAGVGRIFLDSKQTYRLQDAQSRLQENARFALELLTNDIRMAGFSGCANLSSITPNVIANAPTITLTAATALSGKDDASSSWNPAPSSTQSSLPLAAGTDVITVQFSQGCSAHLKGNMAVVNANIQIMSPNSCGIDAGDALMISDCVAADVFRATSASGGAPTQTVAHANNVNTSNNLSKTYQQDAELFIFASRSYYIANGAGGQPSLWRLDNTAATGGDNPIELVEGVENMQILYGEDTNGDRIPDQYRTVNNVGNLVNVVAVRASLLLRTLDNNLLQLAQTYNYNDAPVTATDRRLRHTFTTTVNLRNRSP